MIFFDLANTALDTFTSSYKNASEQKEKEIKKLQEMQDNLKPLDDILTQTNTYDQTIPLVFGSVKLAGNIIWKGNYVAKVTQSNGTSFENVWYDNILLNQSGLSEASSYGGAEAKQSFLAVVGKNTEASFNYVYTLDFAVGICEGEVDELLEVTANGEKLNLSDYTYRFYKGEENQNVDPLIESFQGASPAFNGLCYIVFEKFPLHKFGNSMPKLVFSVQRNVSKSNENSVNQLVEAVTLIPGTGEFAYHTEEITKYKVRGTRSGDVLLQNSATVLNVNNNSNKADVLVSLDQLQKQLPNLKWVSVVVNWFVDGLDCGSCNVFPAAEYGDYNMVTKPVEWSVAGKTRQNSRTVSKDASGNLRYGGTPSDDPIVKLLTELKRRGLKVNLIPMLMVDAQNKPWRGRITGNTSSVSSFFHKQSGYNNFILHYANLTKNLIDCLVVGTEMVGLTKIRNGNSFPAVEEFSNLTNVVRGIVGNDVLLTYAADWSEYHHTDGFYNMDSLWANPNINFIGIDAYFPLTDVTSKPTVDEIMNGWESGEGWDFYYDSSRTQKLPLSSAWAWKNIRWFIENVHVNSDGTQTAWVPKSKKVWFVEYGFPSVELATNQPNVFYDSTSSESAFPRKSSGMVDFESQRDGIVATELFCRKNQDIIENQFVWTWDARPFPFFPNASSIWADAPNWKTGHWINGKVMSCFVVDVIKLLFEKSGITNYHVGDISGIMSGMVVKGNSNVYSLMTSLSLLYNFRIFENNGVIIADEIKNLPRIPISSDDILISKNEVLDVYRTKGVGIKKFTLKFYDSEREYTINHVHVFDDSLQSGTEAEISVPFALTTSSANSVAVKAINMMNYYQIRKIVLPRNEKYGSLSAGSVVLFEDGTYGIVEQIDFNLTEVDVELMIVSPSILETLSSVQNFETVQNLQILKKEDEPSFEILDIPNFTNRAIQEGMYPLWFAFKNVPKNGATIYYSTGGSYIKMFEVYANSVMGTVVSNEVNLVSSLFTDELNTIDVLLDGSFVDVGSSNLCVIGSEIIDFQSASDVNNSIVTISNLLRARFSSSLQTSVVNERFCMLQNNVRQFDFPVENSVLYFKIVANGKNFEDAPVVEFVSQKRGILNWDVKSLQKTLLSNGDILLSWNESLPVGYYAGVSSKSSLKNFIVTIFENKFEVTGSSSFTYTKAMQEKDGFSGNVNSLMFDVVQV